MPSPGQREVDLEAAPDIGEDEGDDGEVECVERPRGEGGEERLPLLAGNLFCTKALRPIVAVYPAEARKASDGGQTFPPVISSDITREESRLSDPPRAGRRGPSRTGYRPGRAEHSRMGRPGCGRPPSDGTLDELEEAASSRSSTIPCHRPADESEKKRFYRLTRAGHRALAAEPDRLAALVKVAMMAECCERQSTVGTAA